jgi:multiple sugar transport system permease protein
VSHLVPAATPAPKGGRALAYAIVGVACLVSMVPFLYIVSTALKDTNALFSYPPQWIPSKIFWGNFTELLSNRPFVRWTTNTLIFVGSVTVLKLLFDSMAGYAFAKMEFRGRKLLFVVVLATMMIPFAAILVPLFFLVRDLGILNTYWALILPPLANPLGIFMMRSFIEQLPNDLEHAARLDGCSEFQIYRRIIVPLIKPGLVVLGVYTFMTQYTSFLWPLVAVNTDEMRVLTTGLSSLKSINGVNWGLISAGGVLTMVPITFLFVLFQRYFVASSLAGALKQ